MVMMQPSHNWLRSINTRCTTYVTGCLVTHRKLKMLLKKPFGALTRPSAAMIPTARSQPGCSRSRHITASTCKENEGCRHWRSTIGWRKCCPTTFPIQKKWLVRSEKRNEYIKCLLH